MQTNRTSRFHCGFSGNETVSSREESSRHSSTMSRSATNRENFSATPSQSNRETDGHNKGHSASRPAIQASAASQISGPSSGNQSYEAVVTLSVECKQALSWWVESITVWNGRSILNPVQTWQWISPWMHPRWAGEYIAMVWRHRACGRMKRKNCTSMH